MRAGYMRPNNATHAQRAWTSGSTAKANPSQHKLRGANRIPQAEVREGVWRTVPVEPGPGGYEVKSYFDPALVSGPPGFSSSLGPQRPEPRIKVHPLGRVLGPGTYDITGFGSLERYQSTRQEPWRRDRPGARAAKSLVEGRPTATRERDVIADPSDRSPPGPGSYAMERYSGFAINSWNSYGKSTRPATSSFGSSQRADITSRFGDSRNTIICPGATWTPSAIEYTEVPRLDRITLSTAGPALNLGLLEPMPRGRTPFLTARESLRPTLGTITMHSPGRPKPKDLTARFRVTVGSP